ncbi:MAG: hypothetical protein AAGG47_21740 [Pseudomonadota bacterium]
MLGSGLLHAGYKLLFLRAYAHGNLAQVRANARDLVPLIVTVVSFTGGCAAARTPIEEPALPVLAVRR